MAQYKSPQSPLLKGGCGGGLFLDTFCKKWISGGKNRFLRSNQSFKPGQFLPVKGRLAGENCVVGIYGVGG